MQLLVSLRDDQTEAVEKAISFDGFGLFMEQRTGKTRTSLAIVAKRHPADLLIVCPKKVIPVWASAIDECLPDYHGIRIRVINFESVWRDRKELAAWMENSPRSMMIIDESHRIKKKGSRQSKACRVIAWKRSKSYRKVARATYRLALSGTPLAQGLEDAWAQFDFIDPSVFGTWENFESRYIRMGGYFNRQHKKHMEIVGYQNQDEFEEKFHGQSFRTTMQEIRKTPQLIQRVRVKERLTTVAQVVYDELEAKMEAEVKKKRVSVSIVISLIAKLQQICGGFIKTDEGEEIRVHGQKRLMVSKILSKHVNEKVVICAKFLWEIDYIERLVKRLNLTYTVIKGGTQFKGELQTEVAIIQIQSGIGIDLGNADVMVFYSWDYSFINHGQAKARISNFTKRKLLYYYLIMEGTVDEHIYQVVTKKKKLVDVVCDHYRRK